VYGLTDRGRQLEPVVLALGRWGSQAPLPPDHGELGVDALVLALKTLFDPTRADGLMGRAFELRLGDSVFALRATERGLEATRGPATDPTATIIADPGVLQDVLWHGRAGGLEIAGDRRRAERFLQLFPLANQA
jgi:hypothetical protein